MFQRIAALFRGRPAIVRGAGKLAEGQAKIVTFGDVLAGTGVEVIFTRVGGELTAINATCPHEGARLDEGSLHEGTWLVCPMHQYYFDPKSGAERSGRCRNSKAYRVREVGDDAEIWL